MRLVGPGGFDEDKLGIQQPDPGRPDEKVATRDIGTGQFVIGDSKVRPRLDETFPPQRENGYLRSVL